MQKNKTNIPVATKVVNNNQNPRMSSTPTGTVVRHKELYADLYSTTNYFHFQRQINPALPLTFPWLSKIAGAYETYKFRKLKFSYVPQCSTASTGSVGMYFDYDPSDGVTTSIKEFANMHQSTITQVWGSNELLVNPQKKDLFTRAGLVSEDLKLYDYGTFNYFMTGSSTEIYGMIFIEYEIEFYKPHNHLDTVIYQADTAYGRWNSAGAGITPSSTPSNTAKLQWGSGADAGKFKLSNDVDGLFEVVATVATPSGQNITQVCGSNRVGIVATIANMITEVRTIVNLVGDTYYIPFAISAGVIGANSLITLTRLSQDP